MTVLKRLPMALSFKERLLGCCINLSKTTLAWYISHVCPQRRNIPNQEVFADVCRIVEEGDENEQVWGPYVFVVSIFVKKPFELHSPHKARYNRRLPSFALFLRLVGLTPVFLVRSAIDLALCSVL
jgi:hypothetical protein